jgi:hypothetical protein
VDELYSYMKHNEHVTKSIIFENEPIDASWGERFFIFVNQMAINYRLLSHYIKNEFNNY